MREQFNFSMSDDEAAPILAEARKRGMLDKDGNVNRAMIARSLVCERIGQITPSDSRKFDVVLQEAVAAGVDPSAELKRAIRREHRKAKRSKR